MQIAFKTHNRFKGFTLIELVIIIVILGILAAIAAPKFTDLSSEARISALEGLIGSIESAISMQHSVALVNQGDGGLENGFIHDGILFDQGYPVALDFDVPFGSFNQDNDPDDIPEILEAVSIDFSEWASAENINGSENGELTRELYITSSDVVNQGATAAEIIATNCYISYDSFLLVPERPVVKLETSGC